MPSVKNISFSYLEFGKLEELDQDDQELITAAKGAAGKAYAPYSGFMVGAALRLQSGRIVTGANVENAAFPSGICAERTALSFSVSNFPDDKPSAIAITAKNANDFKFSAVSPCGNCRQVLSEEEIRSGSLIRVLLYGNEKVQVFESISQLLPVRFSQESFRPYLP